MTGPERKKRTQYITSESRASEIVDRYVREPTANELRAINELPLQVKDDLFDDSEIGREIHRLLSESELRRDVSFLEEAGRLLWIQIYRQPQFEPRNSRDIDYRSMSLPMSSVLPSFLSKQTNSTTDYIVACEASAKGTATLTTTNKGGGRTSKTRMSADHDCHQCQHARLNTSLESSTKAWEEKNKPTASTYNSLECDENTLEQRRSLALPSLGNVANGSNFSFSSSGLDSTNDECSSSSQIPNCIRDTALQPQEHYLQTSHNTVLANGQEVDFNNGDSTRSWKLIPTSSLCLQLIPHSTMLDSNRAIQGPRPE